ncbi:MAG: hypothetical protein ACK5Z2_19240 [Bacteroidota bacterium]|jgi:hypothetical protein
MDPTPINNLDPLDKECYTTLKNEFIQIFNSFRLLFLYQIAGFCVLVYNSTNADNSAKTFLICIFMIVICWICHKIGKTWLSQAVRQVSYTFVAFELPRLLSVDDLNNDDKYVSATRGLWVLANRAEKVADNNNQEYKPASEIKLFYEIQLIYLFVTLIICAYKVFTDYNTLMKISVSTIISGIVYIILLILVAVIFYRHYKFSSSIIDDATVNWIQYFNNKKEKDDAYIKQYHICPK